MTNRPLHGHISQPQSERRIIHIQSNARANSDNGLCSLRCVLQCGGVTPAVFDVKGDQRMNAKQHTRQ